MSETNEEKLDRVRLMAGGDPTWDLSSNDLAALKHVMAELDRLQAIEREYSLCRDRVAEIASRESEQHAEQQREINRLQAIVDRLKSVLDGVVSVSKPVEIDGKDWIAIPRAAWMAAAKARKQ